MSLNDYDINYKRYLGRKYTYDKSNVVSKLVTRITGKYPKAPEPLRYAIKYGQIGMPFRRTTFHDGWSYTPDWEEHNVDPIVDDSEDSIDDLWTVVEYDGDDIFTDLVTGQKFRMSFKEGRLTELMDLYDRASYERNKKMEEGNKRVQEMYDGYVEVPLAIGGERSLRSLDAEKKEAILDETVPQRDKIVERLAKKEKIAREAVVSKYKDDVEHFGRKAEEIREKEEARQREIAEREEKRRIEREEEERKEELERMKREEREKAVGPRFDEMFGHGYKK